MSQNEIKLPTGSDRNKIEALAEQIGQAGEAIKTLQASGAQIEEIKSLIVGLSNRPVNLLKNAAFLNDYMPEKAQWSCLEARSSLKKMSIAKGIGYPVAPSWSLEIKESETGYGDEGFIDSLFRSRIEDHDSPTMFMEPAKAAYFGQSLCRSVLFQEFNALGAVESWNDPISKENDLFCYLRFASGGGTEWIKYGLVELDKNGNATRFIAAKRVQTKGTYFWCEDWLKVPNVNELMSSHSRYAFFVEREAADISNRTLVSGAGVYWGKLGERPELAKTERGEGSIFRLNESVNATKKQFSFPSYPMKYVPEKQFAFVLIDQYGYVDSQAKNADFTLDNGVVQVTNAGTIQTDLAVWGCYMPNLYINYFALT
ncbi:hypothetical protein E2K03_00685 [Vibrio cholerae]|nr:hypothetical protein [Vibrio cholerae]